MIKLVAFDFDDTLSLNEEAGFEIENYIAKQLGFPPMTRKVHQEDWGLPIRQALPNRIPGVDPEAFMKLFEQTLSAFADEGKMDIIAPKNIKTIKKLKGDGKRLAILTARSFHEAEHLLDESHHINKFVEKIYHADSSRYMKPDPRVFDQVLEDFQVLPHEVVYVGDSLTDAIAAKEAGLHFIALLESGLRTREVFDSVQVDYFAQTFEDILDYIKKY